MPHDPNAPGYAAVGIYHDDDETVQLMANADGRAILFDTTGMAQQVLPRLGEGRQALFTKDGETILFYPKKPGAINRLVILTGYDVYNLPPGLPLPSETRSREWKHHIIWTEVEGLCPPTVKEVSAR